MSQKTTDATKNILLMPPFGDEYDYAEVLDIDIDIEQKAPQDEKSQNVASEKTIYKKDIEDATPKDDIPDEEKGTMIDVKAESTTDKDTLDKTQIYNMQDTKKDVEKFKLYKLQIRNR